MVDDSSGGLLVVLVVPDSLVALVCGVVVGCVVPFVPELVVEFVSSGSEI